MVEKLSLVLLLVALLSLTGVGCVGAKPWERAMLARQDMAWSPDAQRAQRLGHIYFSKEAALPGGGAGGGGCGCN
jgi:hypothetical protein